MIFYEHPGSRSTICVTYSAISFERGSWSCSSGPKGMCKGKDGVNAVIVLLGSIWMAEVGDKLSSGTAFS